MYRWILEPSDCYAVLANVALKNVSRDYHVIVEIASVLKPEELVNVRRAYQYRFHHSLEEHVAAHTSSGYFRQVKSRHWLFYPHRVSKNLTQRLGIYKWFTFLSVLFDGLFWQFLVGLVSSFRYDGDYIHPSLAKYEAEILHEAIQNKNGNLDEVIRILTTRSKKQLKATFNRYRDDHGYSISKVWIKRLI